MADKHPLSIATQVEELQRAYPLGQLVSSDDKRLRWLCNVRPKPVSQNYFIQIKYSLGQTPTIHVLAPDLETRPGEPLPHIFPDDSSLCVYDCRSGKNEWHSGMSLAEVVPWISLWLFYYEIWFTTGKWCGKKAKH